MTFKFFSIKINLVDTAEVFAVKKVCNQTKIKELKIRLELIAGIPSQLQRIMYLDQGDMEDDSTLKHHDVVSGAQLTMHIWTSWLSLIQNCVLGNVNQVMSLGVTPDSSFTNANVHQMTLPMRREYFAGRCVVALYVACHRGQTNVVKALLASGADVSSATKFGRTALHFAAANGQEEVIDILLQNDAEKLIHMGDFMAITPLQTAYNTGHKACARKLFLFQWQKRAKKMLRLPQLELDDLMAHQLFDSSARTWLRGTQQQMYQSHILPPQEFQGSRINSKRSDYFLRRNKERVTKQQPQVLPPLKKRWEDGTRSRREITKEKRHPILVKQLFRGTEFDDYFVSNPPKINF